MSDLTDLQKMKIAVRKKVLWALKTDKLVRPDTCLVCHKVCKPDGHHEDYSKPLEVVWMCHQCHLRHHCLPKGLLENIKST